MDKSIAELKRAVAEAAAVMDAARERYTNAEIAAKVAKSATVRTAEAVEKIAAECAVAAREKEEGR